LFQNCIQTNVKSLPVSFQLSKVIIKDFKAHSMRYITFPFGCRSVVDCLDEISQMT